MSRQAPMSRQVGRTPGFSLLEVIVATAILTASAILLLSLFSTGERHGNQAGSRVLGQMLCQSTLDELLANPSLIQQVVDEPVPGFPGWTYSVDWSPASVDGLIALHVSVGRGGAPDRLQDSSAGTALPAFELVRWTRFDSQHRSDSGRSPDALQALHQP